MTTTVASRSASGFYSGRSYLLFRRLHSLTGIVFGGYLVVHLIVNATLMQAGDVYQTQVQKIHSLPFLPVIEWVFIYLPIIYHTLYGTWIIVTGQPNAASYPYGKNWMYLLQRISAVYIVGFIAFHVLSLKYGVFGPNLGFNPEHARATIVAHMKFSPAIAWVVYPLGVLASSFHTANGFWTAAVTWGLTVSAGSQRRWGYLCVALGVLLFAAGMVALFGAAILPVPAGTQLPAAH